MRRIVGFLALMATGAQSQLNLKQLALAMIDFAEAHQRLMPPAAIYDKEGRPLLSWRVLILPYIEQQQLFMQFKLDEPWDGPHNIKLLEKMPVTFAPPISGKAKPNCTFYQVFDGPRNPGPAFCSNPKAGLQPFISRLLGKSLACFRGAMDNASFPASFTDGLSNTILIAEAGEAVPWTKPADLRYDAKGPLPKLGGLFANGFNAAMGDGHAVFVDTTIVNEKSLHAVITRDAGDKPGKDDNDEKQIHEIAEKVPEKTGPLSPLKQSQNNLVQCALALVNYADSKKNHVMPPAAVFDKDGRPLLSWRVLVLPFIEETQLYEEFKLTEPWDSPHNIKLLKRIPKVFASPVAGKAKEPYLTFYQVFDGPRDAFGPVFCSDPKRGLDPFPLFNKASGKVQVFRGARDNARFPATFLDGTSNTILVAEAAEAVPWTKPADLRYNSKGPLPKLGGLFANGFNAAMADGHVVFVNTTGVSDKTLRAAITAAAGDVLGPDWEKATKQK
jgi:prepilin-type processing-associated H-X9-DG protein